MKMLGQYQNGNYTVSIYDDGTKVRENNLDFFEPEYPESMDIKITNSCDMMCPFCHEASTPDGKHGDILNLPFIDTLLPYTELAIGGGNPLSHPDVVPFLEKLKSKNLIANMTVNQAHFMNNVEFLKKLTDKKLLYGLGISYIPGQTAEDIAVLTKAIKEFPNAVLHVINGMVSVDELRALSGPNSKVLILGYKTFRRGVENRKKHSAEIISRKRDLYKGLPMIINDGWFNVLSFDNLAVDQLNVRRLLSDEQWEQFYMGNDGKFTMYVDAVNREYAVCSTSTERYPMTNDIKEMFAKVRRNTPVA